MKTNNNSTLLVTTVICLIPMILGLLTFKDLPAQMPVHFNNAGDPDNYLPKTLAVYGLPLLQALINLYVHFRVNRDPKIDNSSRVIRQAAKWVVPVISVIFMPLNIVLALGAKIPIAMIGTALAGIVIVICGNYLPKNRQNYTIGFKLPWTLNSEENWNKTNRFAGFVWVIGGLIIIANAFLSKWVLSIPVLFSLVILPVLYSFIIYQAENKKGQNS